MVTPVTSKPRTSKILEAIWGWRWWGLGEELQRTQPPPFTLSWGQILGWKKPFTSIGTTGGMGNGGIAAATKDKGARTKSERRIFPRDVSCGEVAIYWADRLVRRLCCDRQAPRPLLEFNAAPCERTVENAIWANQTPRGVGPK